MFFSHKYILHYFWLFSPKIDERKNYRTFWSKLWLNPFKKDRFLILSKMDICSCLKKAGFYPPHNFTLFLASFHEKCFKGKTECFDQNHGLTLSEKSNYGTLKKERFLAIVQKDFFFYLEQHFTFNVSNWFYSTTPLFKTVYY